MANPDALDTKDEGKRMWASVNDQLVEMAAFFRAMIGSFARFCWAQKWGILVFGILGMGGGYWKYSQLEETYTERMTLSYVHLEKKIYGDMLLDLNRAVDQGELSEVPGFTDVSEGTIEALVEVRGVNIKGEPLSEDLSAERVPFYLKLEMQDKDHLDELESAILTFLDSPQFVQERLVYNEERAQAKIENLTGQIESIKTELEESEDSEVRATLFDQLEQLRAQLEETRGSLQFNRNIEVLDGLEVATVVMNEPSLKWLWMGVTGGILLALTFGAIRLK